MKPVTRTISRGSSIAAAVAFLLTTPCFASFSGTAADKAGQPLTDCRVQSGNHSGLTGPDGSFDLATPGGEKDKPLQIHCPGYAPRFIESGGETAFGDITLQRPNFILLLSDDQGWVQTSTQMDPEDPTTRSDFFRTPNIDSFFEGGMRFVRGYSPGTYCMPTRRAIQVGQSTLKHAFNGRPVPEWTGQYLDLVTIPRVLKAADPDYRAAHFGKWDLRFDHPHPAALGYDESDGPTGNGEGNRDAVVDGKLDKFTVRPSEDPKNIFDLTRRGSTFMEEQVAAGRPFYLQLSHYALHLSIFYRQETYDRVSEWPTGEKHYIPSFAAMLKDMDDGFGQLFDKVRELGIEDHTYIIYMGDNGGRPFLNLSDGSSRERRNEPLSEGKHSIYEGGIRVPFGITGPGIEPGSVTRTSVSGMDILPTIAGLVDSDLEFSNIDGGSLEKLIYRQSDTVERPYPFMVFHDKSGTPRHGEDENTDSETAIMQGDYKLIKTWHEGALHNTELYNIRKDPGEANDLAGSMPDLAAGLGKMLDDYIAQAGGDVTIDHDDWPPKPKKKGK